MRDTEFQIIMFVSERSVMWNKKWRTTKESQKVDEADKQYIGKKKDSYVKSENNPTLLMKLTTLLMKIKVAESP